MASNLRTHAVTERKNVKDAFIYAYDEYWMINSLPVLSPDPKHVTRQVEHRHTLCCESPSFEMYPKSSTSCFAPAVASTGECVRLLYYIVTTMFSLTFHYSNISYELYSRPIMEDGASVIRKDLFLQAESEREEDVQSAFLSWLHALSHQPLACLTTRTDLIVLRCTEGISKTRMACTIK